MHAGAPSGSQRTLGSGHYILRTEDVQITLRCPGELLWRDAYYLYLHSEEDDSTQRDNGLLNLVPGNWVTCRSRLNIHWRGVYVKVWRDGSSIVTEILLIGVDARGRNFGLWYYSRFYCEYLSQSITHLQIIIEGIAQSHLEVLFGPVEFNTFQVLVLIGISEPCGGPAQVVMFIIPSPLSIRLITCSIFGRGSFWHSINAPELLSIVFIGGCYNSTSFYTNLLSPFVNIFQRVVLFVDVLRIEVHLCSRGFLHISGLSRF